MLNQGPCSANFGSFLSLRLDIVVRSILNLRHPRVPVHLRFAAEGVHFIDVRQMEQGV